MYRECTFCVMDTSDPAIRFDGNGRCNHCIAMEAGKGTAWFNDESGLPRLAEWISQVRESGRGKEHDCIIGLSGGVDSSYVALKLHEWGIRPRVIHVDAGWNTPASTSNIEGIVEFAGWQLETHVIDWEDMRRLQVAYLRSGVANQDAPQDHAFFATLYRACITSDTRLIVTGGNAATEGILPPSWGHAAMDARNLKAINAKFGDGPLRSFPTISFTDYYFVYPQLRRLRTARPLNLLPYERQAAIAELRSAIDWRDYGAKHNESVFTRFFQGYVLPTRFGYDKRRPHLSSEIVSGQRTREEAVEALRTAAYSAETLHDDRAEIAERLEITESDLDRYLAQPPRRAEEFDTWDARYRALKMGQSFIERVTRRKAGVYS